MNILYQTETGNIISAGNCSFTAGSGEAVITATIDVIPENIQTHYYVTNSTLTVRETPLTDDEYLLSVSPEAYAEAKKELISSLLARKNADNSVGEQSEIDDDIVAAQQAYTYANSQTLTAKKEAKIKVLKGLCLGQRLALKKAPIYKQNNVALYQYSESTNTQIKNWITAIRQTIDEKETAINAATNTTELNAVDIEYTTLETRALEIEATL